MSDFENREEDLRLALNIALSKLRAFSAVMSQIACATPPNTPVRLDSLHLAFEMASVTNWLEIEQSRIDGLSESGSDAFDAAVDSPLEPLLESGTVH